MNEPPVDPEDNLDGPCPPREMPDDLKQFFEESNYVNKVGTNYVLGFDPTLRSATDHGVYSLGPIALERHRWDQQKRIIEFGFTEPEIRTMAASLCDTLMIRLDSLPREVMRVYQETALVDALLGIMENLARRHGGKPLERF